MGAAGGIRKPIARVVVVAAALALAGAFGCAGKKDLDAPNRAEAVSLAVTPWPASAPVYIAQEKGYFRDEGLQVTLRPNASGHLGLHDVLAGEADLAVAGDTPIARAMVDGRSLAVVATICEIDRAILIIARKDRGIAAPDDLRGKAVGLVAGTTAEFYLHIYLTVSQIDPQEVRIVHLAPEALVDALLSGAVDAVSTWAPQTIVLRDQLGSRAVVLYDPSIYTMTWNLVATQAFVQAHPGRLRKFLRAVLRANLFINEHSAETRAISAKNIGTDSPLFEREWTDYHFAAVLDQSLILNLEDQARWMIKREAGRDRMPPNFLHCIHVEGLKAVQPGAVRIAGR